MNKKITNNLTYIGVDDKDIRLFESQFDVPNGMAYNSYLITTASSNIIFDTVDRRMTDEWVKNVEDTLNGKEANYLVISHLEPDHSANIKLLADKYPSMKIISNEMTFKLLPQFFSIEGLDERKIVVKEAEELKIDDITLQFFMAPMVHWPEVMFTYYKEEKVLFTADAFGKFGTLDTDEDWACEARRYYFNIVGKYGVQVQNVLKKLSSIDVKIICPLHGPILKENLEYYINKYDIWSSYKPEDEGIFITYASIHGNTEVAALKLKEILEENGAKKVAITNLVLEDMAEAVEDAFRYDKLIVAASSYNGEVFPPMEHFLNSLRAKNYQNRKVAIVENGTWAPSAARTMKSIIEQMKNIDLCEKIVTIKTTMNEKTEEELNQLAKCMIDNN